MFPAGRPHRSEHGAHDGTADANEGDHDDEPANGHCLRDHHAAARLAAFLAGVHRSARPAIDQKESITTPLHYVIVIKAAKQQQAPICELLCDCH